MLVALLVTLAVLFGGAGNGVSAQTAHFSGAGSMSTVGSGFSLPTGMVMDSSGNLYVADFMNNAVKEILAVNGSIPATPTIVTVGSGFSLPLGVAVDASGNVFVADGGAVKEVLAVDGSIPASPAIRTLAALSRPSGIAVDGNGNVFVSIGCVEASLAMSSASAMASSSGGSCGPVEELLAVNGSIPASPTGILLNGFIEPAGITVDASGNVYVADFGSNSVKEIQAINGSVSLSSTIRTLASFTGTAGPAGVALDSSGDIYVADAGANSVYEVMAVNGSIPTSPTVVTIGSGFNYPIGVAVDGNGVVYVADTENNRVTKSSLATGNFGSVNIGTTSPTIPMFFTFDTTAVLDSKVVVTQGAVGLDFTDAGTGTCKAGTVYTAGQTCTINVVFTPKFAGTRNGAAVLNITTSTESANVTGSFQGTGVGPQIDFYPGTTSTLTAVSSPQGLAVDNNGDLFVASASGIYAIPAVNGSIPSSPSVAQLPSTSGNYHSVALDASDNLYTVGYPGNSVIEVEAASSTPGSPVIVTLASGFNNLQYLALDRSGNVYVADSVNSAVKEILSANGSNLGSPTIVTLASEPACTIGPLAVDGNGDVFFACGQSLMEIVAVNGSIPASPVVKTLASQGSYSGITVDANGNVYATSPASGIVQEILAVNGNVPASPYIFPLGQGFFGAEGLAVDANGDVYIADTANNRLVKLNPSTPPSIAFAPTTIGATSIDSPELVAVTNVGNLPLTFPIPSTGTNPTIGANFTIGSMSTCAKLSPSSFQPGTLAPGASCTMLVSFTPTMSGALSSSLVLADNNLNAAAPGYAAQSITLAGTGNPLPNFTISAPDVTLTQGATSKSTVTTTVTNPGGLLEGVQLTVQGLPGGVTGSISPNPTSGTSTLTLTASGIAAPGTYSVAIMALALPPGSTGGTTSFNLTVVAAPGFTLSASPASLTIAQGGSGTSTITVLGDTGFTGSVSLYDDELPAGVTSSYLPSTTSGTSVVTLTVSSDAPIGSYNASLIGYQQNPLLPSEDVWIALTIVPPPGFAPSSANLGAANIGTASLVQTLTYTFGSAVTLGSTAVLTQGTTGLDFADAASDSCVAGTAYTAGQSCTVNVTFTPKYAGTRYGAVVINDNNGNAIATAYLQGTGVGPQVNFLPGTESTVASFGLVDPYGVAVDGSGNVYIADSANNRILKETLSGGAYNESTIPTSCLDFPLDVAVDARGNVYISDAYNYRVLKETPTTGGYIETVMADLSPDDNEPLGNL